MRIAILGAVCTGKSALAQALARSGILTIADTTPLMTAIYSDVLFQDTSRYAEALSHQRSYDLTLVTATDLPWVSVGVPHDGETTRTAVDRKLRAVLQAHQIAHTVICGSEPSRTLSALESVAHWHKKPLPRSAHDTDWKWACNSCSDPECEHRLFSQLLSAP
ncbi:MAG: AAA family ATPase [Burkholderiales bacterium]|nr:AAA family ATPase [Burkholderiales bacterium]